MKYSYFNTLRSGNTHMNNLALYNNKTVAQIFKTDKTKGFPLVAYIMKPEESIQEWYWDDKKTTVTRDYNMDFTKIMDDFKKRPRPTHWYTADKGKTHPPIDCGDAHKSHLFHKSFPKLFESDWILYALCMLGFQGKCKQLDDMLTHNKPNVVVDLDFSVEQFKKRINIIPYKEDIRHFAKGMFLNNYTYYSNDWFDVVSERINYARIFHIRVQKLLERLDIPYRLFSLDSGDYSTIGFEKDLPRNQTDDIDPSIPSSAIDKLDSIVDRYMSENP